MNPATPTPAPAPAALALLVALACAGPAAASNDPVVEPGAAEAPSGALTLADALALASRNHPTGQVADARIEQARATRRGATAGLAPELSAQGTYTRRPGEVRVDGAGAVIQTRDALRGSSTLVVPVLDLVALQSVSAAGTGLQATREESAELRRNLGFRVGDVFLAALAAEQVLEAAERRAALAEQVVEAARLRLSAGVGTRNDVTRTELERASAELEVVVARGEVARTREVLAALLGVDEVGALADPTLLPPPVEPALRPDVAALELRAEQARQEAKALMYGYVPALGAFGQASATNEAGFLRRQYDWSVGAQASWSVFDGGRRLAAASRSRAVADEFDARARELGTRVRQDLETAHADLATADAAFRVAGVRAQVAQQNADEVQERFSLGLATALEVSDAAATAFEAAATLARQRFERKRSALAVGEAMGAWPEELLP